VSARRLLAAVAAAALVGGCAQTAASGGDRHGRSGRAEAWSMRVDWPFSLGVAGGDAVVTISRNRVVDLDTANGRERWRTEVAQVTHYEPALDARTVLVSADDRFVALERDSGVLRWEAAVGERAGGVVLTRAGSDPVALVTTERGLVAALDGSDGRARWSVQLPGDISAAPAADAGAGAGAVLWTGAQDESANRLRVFDLATGSVRWESVIEPGATAPVIHEDLVVLGEGNGNFAAGVVGRDLASGAERWSVPAPASFESGVTPGAAGGDVAVCDHSGTITLVDARAGKARWQTAIREPILDTRVLVSAQAVVVRTHGGKVVVLDRESGRVVRRLDPDGFPVGIGAGTGRLVFAVRLARPDRIQAEALPGEAAR
jgi:outer membrane protein assembly factor BamB